MYVGRRMLLPSRNNHTQDHPQVTHELRVKTVAGAAWLVRVITYLCLALLAEQRLHRSVESSIHSLSSAPAQ